MALDIMNSEVITEYWFAEQSELRYVNYLRFGDRIIALHTMLLILTLLGGSSTIFGGAS